MGNKLTKKITSVVLSATTAVWLSGAAVLMPVAHAQTVAELQAQIQALLAQIATLQTQLAAISGAPAPTTACNFTRNLTVGMTGEDVRCLQQYLNSDPDTVVAASGAGSPGNETTFFGSLTRAAVIKWQNKFAAQVLAPVGLTSGTGFWGPSSMSHYNALVAAAPAPAPAPAPTPAPAPVGVASSVTVSLAPTQPAEQLFPKSAASVPFTKLLFTASPNGDATIDSVTVERTGSANNAAFDGVILLDENGIRVGTAKSLGSDNKATLTEDFVVKAGTTREMTLAGDAASDLSSYVGQLASLSLAGVQTMGGTSVNVSLPLTGTTHTVNNSLTIGSATLARGALDPGVGATKEVGTQGYIFSSLKLTAGSAEKVLLKSIKWNQSGSAASGDLENVKVVVDGTEYPTTVSSDGKFYTSAFNGGIEIDKGLNKEISIKGDIVSGSNRTVDFDLFRYTDIQVKGLTFGYDIKPSATETTADNDDDGEFQDAEPRYDAYQATIGTGSIQVAKANTVASQNIAINLSDQPLGGFDVTVKGEDITVGAINFDLSAIDADATGGSLDTNDITNIVLVDDAGTVVAGPVDGVAGGNNAVRFTDTITFKVGTKTYTLKGKLGTDFGNNDTVAASTTPNVDWKTVKGTVTNVTITPTPSSALTANTMTVKAADLSVSVSGDPAAQTVVVGTKNFTFAKYLLDASGSGEDIRTTSFKLNLTIGTANSADDLTNCQLFDGSTALNTGTNIVNPANSVTTGDDVTFTLDTGVVTPKGTVKTLELKCNLTGTDGTTYAWGLDNAADNVISTGLTSGQSVTETITTDAGQTMTAATAGTLSVALDTSSPALKLAQAGATDVSLAVFRLTSTNEALSVTQMGLQMATSTTANDAMASNSPTDLKKVTLWVGSTKVGEAVFVGSDYATATLSGVTVPKDGQVLLTVKGDMGEIGTAEPARPGHLVLVNYDAANGDSEGNNGAKAVGQSSGTTVYAGGSDTSSNGARLVRAVPMLERVPLSSSELTLGDGSLKNLFKFKITAPAGTNGLGLYKFTFDVATTTANSVELAQQELSTFRVTNFEVYCYSDSSFSAASCNSFDNSGRLNHGSLENDSGDSTNDLDPTSAATTHATAVSVLFNPTSSTGANTAEAIYVPAGETRYFVLKGSITGSATNTPSVVVKMLGDASWSAGALTGDPGNDLTAEGDSYSTGRYIFATTASNTDSWDDDDFIWSPNSTNTQMSINTYDWFNGFLVPGLPTTETGSETLAK